jgi:hypothetical protein
MTTSIQNSQDQIKHQLKQELRQRIHTALQSARNLQSEACLNHIRVELLALQNLCQRAGKVFIVVEEAITCDRYELGGSCEHTATLFRGPDENASVAICITNQGSLAYRNSSAWIIYRNQGDIATAINSAMLDLA